MIILKKQPKRLDAAEIKARKASAEEARKSRTPSQTGTVSPAPSAVKPLNTSTTTIKQTPISSPQSPTKPQQPAGGAVPRQVTKVAGVAKPVEVTTVSQLSAGSKPQGTTGPNIGQTKPGLQQQVAQAISAVKAKMTPGQPSASTSNFGSRSGH